MFPHFYTVILMVCLSHFFNLRPLSLKLFSLHIAQYSLQFAPLNSCIGIIVVDINATNLSAFHPTALTQKADDISFGYLIFLARADIECHHARCHGTGEFLRRREVNGICFDIIRKRLALAYLLYPTLPYARYDACNPPPSQGDDSARYS